MNSLSLLALTSLGLLGPRATRVKRVLDIVFDELKALLLLRGWYFESAEGTQSRYAFADDSKESKAFADRVDSIQKEHKELVSGRV